MGEQHINGTLSGAELRCFMSSLFNDLRALDRLIKDEMIEADVMRIGAEQELFLVDKDWQPACISPEILTSIADPHFTTELSRFNIEINLDPLAFQGNCLSLMEGQLNHLLAKARRAAA